MNGGGVSIQIGPWCNGPRKLVNALIGQFAGSEVDYPSMVLPSRLQPKVPSQTCLLSDSGNPVEANGRIPITRPIFDNFDSAGQIHNRRGGTALIDNAQKYD